MEFEEEIELEPLTPAQRQQRRRAKQKGLPLPHEDRMDKARLKAEREAILKQHNGNVAWAHEQDEKETFYRGESRSCIELLSVYEGLGLQTVDESEDDDEDEDETPKKSAKKSDKPVANPSITRIKIPAFDRLNGERDPSVCGIVEFKAWLDLRAKARLDLYWLCKVLGHDLFPDVHQIICDQFVKKNFEGMYHPGYTLAEFHHMMGKQERYDNNGVPTREMMLLDSRGFYKSTINMADCISWLVNAPDVQIFIVTGEKSLSKDFLLGVKQHFELKQNSTPTAFQLLFPEYVLTGVDGRSKQPIKCPARILKGRGYSLWVNSIDSSLSGWHFDVKKGDDVVTNSNSNSEETRTSLKTAYDGSSDLMNAGGIIDHIGTRYFMSDWYGTRIEPNPETGKIAPIKFFKRGCWVVKPEYRDVPMPKLTLEMVTLTFPQRDGSPEASFNDLMAKLLHKRDKKNTNSYRTFCNQQLNEPTDDNEDSPFLNPFDEAMIRACTRPEKFYNDIIAERTIQTWDVAYGEKRTSDYSVGAQHKVYPKTDGRYAACTREIIFGKWKASDLVEKIVLFYEKHRPDIVRIEGSLGIDLLMLNIQHYATIKGSDIYSHISVKSVDQKYNAKADRIKDLELLMSKGLYDIVDGEWMPETTKQMVNYSGKKSTAYRKDDIPDAVSIVLVHLPRSSFQDNVNPEELEQEMRLRHQKAEREYWAARIHGTGLGEVNSKQPQKNEEPAAPAKPRDPRLRILGGGLGWRM